MIKTLIKVGNQFRCVELKDMPTGEPVTIIKAEVSENQVDLALLNHAYALGFKDGMAQNPLNSLFQDVSKVYR